ncbi:MAG TPA: hypothetical protein VJ964_08705 [Balneolaceae bacterium]|nr:hypothetical protein [Balneolaceae bacterium]
MKALSKINSFIFVLVLIVGLQPLVAQQSDIDNNRMNRDINIMENVLKEMFKTQLNTGNKKVRVISGSHFYFSGSGDISGTYLPGYGVIFTIPGNQSMITSFSSDDHQFSYSFAYGDGKDGEAISEASITDRISEFLREYGSTIGQLTGSDKVMVIYNAGDSGPEIAFLDSDTNKKRNTIPTISVMVKESDLQAYRKGKINANTFNDRLSVNKVTADKRGHRDLKIMANILETAFKNNDQESFGIMGSVDYLKLDNFGALFSFDARYSNGDMFFGKIAPSSASEAKAIQIFAEKKARQGTKDEDQSPDKEETKHKEKTIKAYKDFISQLKEYLVDYGRTLKSVDSNQRILVSVDFSSRYEEVPERIDMQIQKSTLDAMDQGRMSRNQVINKIQVREY